MGKVVPPIINKENNTRLCRGCNKWLEQTSENWYTLYGKIRTNYCITCYKKKHPSYTGSTATWRVLSKPHTFKHEIQRLDTHEFLQCMGWRWHESGKYWSKPGIVDENGKWENIPEGTPPTGSHVLTNEERQEIRDNWNGDWERFQSEYNITKGRIESALKGHTLRGTKNGKLVPVNYRKVMTPEEKLEVIELEIKGWDHWEIAHKLDRSITAIRNILKKEYGHEGYTARQKR